MVGSKDSPDEDSEMRDEPDASDEPVDEDFVGALATLQNWLDLNSDNVIGIFGKPTEMQALLRRPDGEILKLKAGDAVLGGQVQAIDEEKVVIVRQARAFVLRIGKARGSRSQTYDR